MQGPDSGYDSYGQYGDYQQQQQYHHQRPHHHDDRPYHQRTTSAAAVAAGASRRRAASNSAMEIPPAPARAQRLGVYRLGRTVGMGAFSKVKVAIHEPTGQPVAVKIIDRRQMAKQDMTKKVEREIRIQKRLLHPHVVRQLEVIETPEYIFLVQDYAAGGELYDLIVARGRLPDAEARGLFQQLVCALEHCHRHGVVHRDLKPENILLTADGRRVKLADFGFANRLLDGEFLKTSCGSPNYAAPEIVQGSMYAGPEVDVWSLGVILYALVCGTLPFDDDTIEKLYYKINHGLYEIPAHASEQASDLIRHMLKVDPLRRITLQQVRRHHWFLTGLPKYLARPHSLPKTRNRSKSAGPVASSPSNFNGSICETVVAASLPVAVDRGTVDAVLALDHPIVRGARRSDVEKAVRSPSGGNISSRSSVINNVFKVSYHIMHEVRRDAEYAAAAERQQQREQQHLQQQQQQHQLKLQQLLEEQYKEQGEREQRVHSKSNGNKSSSITVEVLEHRSNSTQKSNSFNGSHDVSESQQQNTSNQHSSSQHSSSPQSGGGRTSAASLLTTYSVSPSDSPRHAISSTSVGNSASNSPSGVGTSTRPAKLAFAGKVDVGVRVHGKQQQQLPQSCHPHAPTKQQQQEKQQIRACADVRHQHQQHKHNNPNLRQDNCGTRPTNSVGGTGGGLDARAQDGHQQRHTHEQQQQQQQLQQRRHSVVGGGAVLVRGPDGIAINIGVVRRKWKLGLHAKRREPAEVMIQVMEVLRKMGCQWQFESKTPYSVVCRWAHGLDTTKESSQESAGASTSASATACADNKDKFTYFGVKLYRDTSRGSHSKYVVDIQRVGSLGSAMGFLTLCARVVFMLLPRPSPRSLLTNSSPASPKTHSSATASTSSSSREGSKCAPHAPLSAPPDWHRSERKRGES